MLNKKVTKSLQNIKDEINNAEPIDNEVQTKLDTLSNQIHNVLENPGDAYFDNGHEFMEHIRDAIEYFEISHPKLTGALSGLISTLSSL